MRTQLAAALILAAQAAAAESHAADIDRAAMMQETAKIGFAKAEEKYLARAGDNGGAIDLAEFYIANELWVEALVALNGSDEPARDDLAAECEYRLGRYGAVIARLDGARDNALLAMALARIGAFAEARQTFNKAPPPNALRNLTRDYFLGKAEAAVEAGDIDAAADFLRTAPGQTDARRRFLLAKVNAARGEEHKAATLLRSAASGDGEWAMRARLAIAEEARDIAAIEALSLKWRGGAFERDMQMALGGLRLDSADYDRGFAALRIVVDRFPQSDAAVVAADRVAATLPALFADGAGLDPRNAASLFFENVEFAPPGREGDRLIQQAVKQLEALGLYAQAAQLLDHQVMKRLRGAERAVIASDLADLYLLAKKPKDALRALRSTRIAGLSDEIVRRRRGLEARALVETGQIDGALALLANRPAASDLFLRAEINWSRRAWDASAADYASFFAASPSPGAPAGKTAAVRAATAFFLAGDRAGYRAFAKEAALRLEGTAEADLIKTLGDVDRERFLADFMVSYRSVYGRDRS